MLEPNYLINRLNEIQNRTNELTEKDLNDIIRLIKNNPQEFIEYMKDSRPVCAGLSKVLTNLPYAATSAMQDRYITPVIYYDETEQKRKVVFIDPNELNDKSNQTPKAVKMMNKIDLNNKVKIYCHSCRHFDDQFKSKLSLERKNKTDEEYEQAVHATYILPLNKIFGSTITSSVQTEPVKNACVIVNYLTDKYKNENNKNLKIDLYGQCQGIDFASKMIGDPNGIKNADIHLHLDTVHILQDTDDIMHRIQNCHDTVNIMDIIVTGSLVGSWWQFWHLPCKTSILERKTRD